MREKVGVRRGRECERKRSVAKRASVARLRKCVFEKLVEGLHAVEQAETKLQHELATVLCAGAAECFERSIGLACREYTAHDASDMEMHRSVWRPWKQLTEQLGEREMSAGVDPIL